MSEPAIRRLIVLLGLSQIAIGCWMVFATDSFGEAVAAFDGYNAHDLRDFATHYLALGMVLLIAAARPAWRFPVLVFATLATAFHTINHAIDVGDSDPGWLGPVDLVALLLATALYAWLARVTAARAR
jgi:hypothetical protein